MVWRFSHPKSFLIPEQTLSAEPGSSVGKLVVTGGFVVKAAMGVGAGRVLTFRPSGVLLTTERFKNGSEIICPLAFRSEQKSLIEAFWSLDF